MSEQKRTRGLYWVKWQLRSRWSLGYFTGNNWNLAEFDDRGFSDGRPMPEPLLVHSEIEWPDHVILERDLGYYWVRLGVNDDWQPAEYRKDGEWFLIGEEIPPIDGPPSVVGPKIASPDLSEDLRVALSLRKASAA